jgi:hypothetical protein
MTSWTVHTKSNGTFSLDHITGTPPQITRGQSITLSVSSDSYSTLQDYIEYGGSYSLLEALNGEVFYDEEIPSSLSIDSIVLGFEPNTDLSSQDVFGLWALVDGGDDIRNRALTNDLMDINLTVLAEYSDYTDHTALEGALLM